jgi:riboflavin biosynthesis pyrimidine reductase
VRALLPEPKLNVDIIEAYSPGDAGPDGLFVRCNMISSLDGAVTLEGRSGMLGGPADRRVFQVLRSWADVIVVGAGTARAERYGPAKLDDALRQARARRGQALVPPIAVVTGSTDLDWSSAFFTEAEVRPILFTTESGAETARGQGGDVADVVVAGRDRVDLPRAFQHLRRAGYGSVLLEGGPRLNAEVVRGGLLDELCLTISPRLVAGDGPRVLAGNAMVEPHDLGIVHLLEQDGLLFYRLTIPRND